MIAYFSGTGNSRGVAERLARATADRLCAVTWTTAGNVRLSDGERLGLVFPVYGWGLPNVMLAFVRRLHIEASATPYIYMVCTCGDDIGRTDRLLARELRRRGLQLDSAWSVVMPNTYTALPGFDVDAPELEGEKLTAADSRLTLIVRRVAARETGVFDVKPGPTPWLKSYVLRLLFNGLFVTDRRLKCDAARCVGCRRCEAVCPVGNIRAKENGNPEWLKHCTGCLACYHACPKHCILCGGFTAKKGQYLFRDF